MMFTDGSRGRNLAKDPVVVRFKGKYLMYYSIGPYIEDRPNNGRTQFATQYLKTEFHLNVMTQIQSFPQEVTGIVDVQLMRML